MVGLGFVVAGAMASVAMKRSVDSKTAMEQIEGDSESDRDEAFADDEPWLPMADLLWAEPAASESFPSALELAADRIAEACWSLTEPDERPRFA